MKSLLFLSLFYCYAYARIYGSSTSTDEPFEANNALFYENAAVESGETFSEDRLEQELLNSIAPTKTFKGTIVARERTLPPASRPIKEEEVSFNEDVSTVGDAETEGSADVLNETTENQTITESKMKNVVTDVQLPVLLGLSSPVFSHPTSEPEEELTTTRMIDITSEPMERTESNEEGSGKDFQEPSFPLDLDGFGEVSINPMSILIGEKESGESMENLKVVKVSGEIGEDLVEGGSERDETETTTTDDIISSKREDEQEDNPTLFEKKPATSGTFLEDNLLPVFLRKKLNSSRHLTAQRGAVDGCPVPSLCAKNCFVSLDNNGCQACECLWQALTCETNDDCPEAIQVCDLGKCECSQGYEQDMSRSGMCRVVPLDIVVNDDASVVQAEQITEEVAKNVFSDSSEKNRMKHKSTATGVPVSLYYGKKHVRVIRATDKLRRPERLQWPGPCDTREHCPPPLHCLQGDCWYLPDKPIRRRSRSRQRDSIPDSFIISNDDEEDEINDVNLHDGQLSLPLTTSKPRGLLRFVSEGTGHLNELRTERTTISPPTTDVFEISTESLSRNLTDALAPFHPDSVKILGETTKTEPISSNVLSLELENFDSPPAPPPVELVTDPTTHAGGSKPSIGSVSRDKIIRTFKLSDEQIADMTKAFTKSIQLPKTEVLKPILKKRRKQVQKEPAKTQGVQTATELNELEFPISSQLRKIQSSGLEVTPPLALSAKPTSEELEVHVQFMKAMNAQRERIQLQSHSRTNNSPRKEESFDYDIIPSTTAVSKTTPFDGSAVQKVGVWYDMENPIVQKSRLNERRRAPVSTTPSRLYMEYTERNVRGSPIRVEGHVIGTFEDECVIDKDCGSRFTCCRKQWCDDRANCGKAKFCLPNCSRTKLVNANSLDKSLLDIVYD